MPGKRKRVEFASDIDARDIRTYLALKKALDEKRAREATVHYDKAREKLRDSYAGPLDLMIALQPDWKRTPALELISEALEECVTTPGSRLIITMAPQESKSESMKHATIRALQHNPNCRIAYASYATWLARRNGGEVRDLITNHGTDAIDQVTGDKLPDKIGLAINPDRSAEGRWSLKGYRGSAVCVGISAGLTGAAVDLLVVDDPIKDMKEADSETIRSRLHDWWDSVAETRLAPHTSVIIIQTRWHLDDLAGRILSEERILPENDREWRWINIPALADGSAPDSLTDIPGGRDEDGWMVSARGDRVPRWSRVKAKRPRVFSALYQGVPTPQAGGIFQADWISASRVGVEGHPPVPKLREIVVGVDPADTGLGDAAGILVAGLSFDNEQYFLADLSGPLSQHQWARRVCMAWLTWDANRVIQEANLGMRNSVKNAWELLRRQAVAIIGFGSVEAASEELRARGDEHAANLGGLREVEPYADKIVDLGSPGPRVVSVTPKQSKRTRAESATEFFESGRAHIVGYLHELEFEMVTWQEGQPSPNRLDVLSMLTMQMDRGGGRSAILV